MFEHRSKPLLSRKRFIQRQVKYALFAVGFIGVSLGIGVWGYMFFGGFDAVDALLNASMILAGMGPMGELPDDAAKLFASFYALYSGIALLTTVGVVLAPLVHRLLHSLHVEQDED
ncbi:MAG: hypothetical protein IPJ76_15215 [Flavobacteriales bacterium]|nr:MAG: hypothetical protein IPJ76_15215 [Flavobacteriales bacterium]